MGLFGDSDAKAKEKAQAAAERAIANANAKREGDIALGIQKSKEYAGQQSQIASNEARFAQLGKEGQYNLLLGAYQPEAQGLYDTSRSNIQNLLGTSRSDIEELYETGYENLQNLVGQESEAAIQESLRPIENKLARQGLLGGPSGALNEALAGAAEQVRNAGISRLADYQGQQTGALSSLYNQQAGQLSDLESAYAGQSKGILDTVLGAKTGLASERAAMTTSNAQNQLNALLGINTQGLEQTASAANASANSALALALAKLQAEQDKKKGTLGSGLGSILGAGTGALLGGGVAGAQLGGTLGGSLGGIFD